MAARDDSVIRGSLIACLIFLVLSLALNFFFWSTGNTATQEKIAAQEKMALLDSDLRTKDDQNRMMKAMLGVGGLSEAEFELLSKSASGDAEMEAIEKQFVQDMAYLGPEVDAQNRNYPALPKFLVNTIRDLNANYGNAREEATTIRKQADSDVENARLAQAQAEKNRDDATKKLEQERTEFGEDRDRMKVTTEETRDSLNKTVQDMNVLRKQKTDEITKLSRRSDSLLGTVETQRLELNRMRNDQFESTQGHVTFVHSGGGVVTINLGSGDALRTGVTFGVIDGDETRLQDAKVKASIQVTKILAEHLAEARVVARPEVRYPIIPGDQIYSPFWAPGRTVKIAIAGDIDIDGDDRPDTEAIKGMIKAAGAVVAAVVSADGQIEGALDSSVRFLVVGETPTLNSSSLASDGEDVGQAIAKIGEIKAQAVEKGITVIPAWKLQAYLKTIGDQLTTPLGSAVRGADFPPERIPGSKRRLPTQVADIFMKQDEGMQKSNEIAKP